MNLAVIDLETTGTDERNGSILEVGVIVVDEQLEVLDAGSWLVQPLLARHLDEMDAVVRDMHTTNGLLAALGDYPGLPVDRVDAKLAELLALYQQDGKVALAGSGVCHFDNRWIRLHLPESAKRLTYWTYDVGVVRRFLRDLCGWPSAMPDEVTKDHRALTDATLHLAELQTYRTVLRQHRRADR